MDLPGKNFQCSLCGECCSGDMKVFLNPHDLTKMTDALSLENGQQLLEQGYIVLDTNPMGVLLPRIAFRQVMGLKFCPFLENRLDENGGYRGLCRLHPHKKPLVCALAPYARELDLESGESRFYFQEPIEGCPGCSVKEIYPMEELFPQVEEELDREKGYLLKLWKLLQRESSPAYILTELFKLEIPK